MFKSFFRHKKQEEPRGFQPKKRYSGPAMRLEEMRTPSGLILGDDTDTTDEPIPADDLDFPLNSPADDTGNNADFDPNDNDTDSSDASDIPDNETEEIEDIDPDDSDSDDTAAETDSDSDDTDSDETDSDDIDSDDATAETDSDETAAHTETDDIADEDLEKLDYIDSDETDSDETDSDETAAHTETDTDDTTAEASDTGESIPSDDIDGEETGETTSELDDTDTAEIASDDSELVAEVASTDNQTASDDSELVAETNPNDTASEANPDSEITDNDTTEESSDNFVVDAELNPNQINFDVGTFTVGETGQVSADFLFDGGKYEGEVAIFNLEGMDEFEFGTPEFIQEAARRSLSSSDMGHVVISDITAAARFDPQYGVNQNLGTYQGVQTFAMRPGDTFAIMLVPKGSVQQVFDNPAATGALRPLFSLATANPNDAHHIGQIADVTGDGSTFAMEDLRVDGNTDKDYNDIIFQVRGAKGTAPLIDQLVAAGKDWRGTNVGKALIEYATPYITPDEPNFDGALSDLVSNLESLFGEVETDGDGLDIASDSTDATDEVFSSDEPKTEELVGDAATDELFASDETETEELVEDATTDEFFSSDETETEELVEDAATDEFFSSDEPETEELVGDAATDEFFSSDEPETEELVGDAATDELLSSDEPETASPVATDATDAEITDETVSETDETVATDATDAAITDETVSETEETVATDATDAVITDETVSETDETVATDATDAAITDATVSETESPVATDATDAAITDETVSETESPVATDATDAAITDETVSETEETIATDATDAAITDETVSETEETIATDATDAVITDETVSETEETVATDATDAVITDETVSETDETVATDATDAAITDATVSETESPVATDATDAAITDETVSETEETIATDATDAAITDETVSETDETIATDATDAAITDETVSETEETIATDATDAVITDETVSETEETVATDATDAAITDETVSETDETIATDATDAAITDETVSETESPVATDATDAAITDETVSETEETIATDATDAAITDETVSETDETIATDATDAAITDETVSETEGTVATDATDAVITDETVSATDETVATDATDAAITDATVSETESPVATETTATATETVVAPKTENSATEVVAPSAEKTDAVTEVSSATPEPVTEANEPTTSDSSDSTDNVETVSDAGNEGNTVSTNSATPGSAAPATPSSTALAQNSNSVNNQNLISRLENLTNNLKQQNSNAAVGSGNNAVSTSLIQQVENLTQKLKTQNPSTPVSANTTALISRLEEMVVKTAPLPAPSQFNFAPANQPLVGVIDTGFAGNNPDINYERIILGQDRVDGDNNPLLAADEGNEHGTHVLGIIGATQNNDIGIDGINDDAPIWVGRAVGSGKWAESLVEFVDAAKVSGQPNAVVNLSLDLTQTNPDGSVTTRYEFTPQERAAIEYARQHNVMLVVAAGNDGGVMSALGQSSQEFDNIITVGAAKRVNDEVALSKAYDRAEYSSYGNGLDIMAPVGDSELSTVGDGVGTMAGTSVATAKVTGAASQIWAANPQLSYRQVIEILKKTATDLAETGFDTATGAGLLNMVAAVQLAKATKPEEYEPAPFLIPTTWSGQGKVTVRERAVNSNSIYLSTDLGEIVQFDLGTGQKRHIYQGQAFTDLAVAPNGKLYGSTFNHLFEINTSTGEETYIGGFGGPNINSLTFSPDGRLYGAEEKSGDVFEISPQTARLTYIGNLGGPSSGDMVFSGASQFFATVGSPLMERDRLVAFDLNTRRARTITELSDDQFYGLAMHNGQLIGYTARNQEIALDPLTGQIKSISVVPVSGAIWGAAQNYNNVSYNPSLSSDWQQAMEREYQDMKGLLGNPTGPYATASRSPQGTEGIWRAYETGTIHWTPQYGAVAVWLDLQREYNEHGGSGGWLGFPTQREHDWNGGKRTLFEGGYIYWDGQRAQAYRHGELPTPNWQQAMEREYQDMKGLLGNPTGSYAIAGRSPKGTEGIWRAYETGTIHWSSQYGAVALWHDLQREYNEHGGSGGWLGFPTQRERDWNGGKRTDFEGGFIYWDGQRATAYRNGEFVITKEYIDKFARVAARSPEIGGAKGPIEHRGNGFLFQPFESGHIEWNGQKFVVTIYGNGNPSVSPPINTPTQGPKIINQSGESGTGRLTAGTNFRSYPWVNDSTSPQLISAGTTFTLLEKVTTDDSTYPNWYKVRLSDGREGYFWANNVEKVGSNSGVPVGDVIKSLKTAIIGQESGYNYQAINPDSGALGFAQIMPGNLPSWSREALGYEITREQFLNSPDLQIRIIEHKLNQYYQNAITASGGNVDIAVRRVASAWYSGNPNLYTSTTPQYYNGNPYPSIADYTLSVLNKFHQAYGTGGSSSYSSNTGGINTGIDNTNPVEDDYYYDEDDIFKDYFEDDRGENVKSWSREQKLNAVIDHIKEYTVEYVKGLGEDALNDIIDSFNEIIDDIKKFPNIDWKALGVRIFDFVAAKLLGRTPVGRAVLAVGRGNSPSDMLAEVLNFIQNPDLGNLRQEIQQLWQDGKTVLGDLWNSINKLIEDFQNLPNSLDNAETEADLDEKGEKFVEASASPLLGLLANLIIGKVGSKFAGSGWSQKLKQQNKDKRTKKVKKSPERIHFDRVVRPSFWKHEAENNAANYSPENLARMRKGKPALDSNGNSLELHHKTPLEKGGTNDFTNLEIMTREDHRYGDNYSKNHPK